MSQDEIELFQHYRVLRRNDGSLWELGRGAMGVTYKAIDTNLESLVALKVINSLYLGEQSAKDRFKREAKAAAALRHRNVASVYHLGNDGQSFFYAMEFIDGQTAEALVHQAGPRPLAEALAIALQVSRALMAAHDKRLVHRDIKPANIMLVDEVDEKAVVKLIDFGLAKSLVEQGGSLVNTNTSGFLGTPLYASPEQCDEIAPDIRSDIYSLGITLWFLIAGKPPFVGSLGNVFAQHLQKPPPFDTLPAGTPECARELLARMLAKDRADRPQTPGELRREIEHALQTLHAPLLPIKPLQVAGRATGGGAASAPTSSASAGREKPPGAFSLVEVIRRRGALPVSEVIELLARLAAAVEALPPRQQSHLQSRLEHVWVHFHATLPNAAEMATRPVPAWPAFHLELPGPIAVESEAETTAAIHQTRVAPADDGKPGGVRVLAALTYELLSGRCPPANYRPLPQLTEGSNALLRRSLETEEAGSDSETPRQFVETFRQSALNIPSRPPPLMPANLIPPVSIPASVSAKEKSEETFLEELMPESGLPARVPSSPAAARWPAGRVARRRAAFTGGAFLLVLLGLFGLKSWQQSASHSSGLTASNKPTPAPLSKTDPSPVPLDHPAQPASSTAPAAPESPTPLPDPTAEPKPTLSVPPPGENFQNTLDMEMVWISPGTFFMGSPPGEQGRYGDETPFKATLTSGYWLGKFEVTQGEYEALTGSNPSAFKHAGKQAPVESVNWEEARAFCRRLTEREQAAGRLPANYEYQLPTEAQWEYAARAGTATATYAGGLKILGRYNAPAVDAIAWYGGNSGVEYADGYWTGGWKEKQINHNHAGPHPVGQKEANPWGLYDMIGNVHEWCRDWYAPYPRGSATDPVGPKLGGSTRVYRGNGWSGEAHYCRAALRMKAPPNFRGWNIGFRAALVAAGH